MSFFARPVSRTHYPLLAAAALGWMVEPPGARPRQSGSDVALTARLAPDGQHIAFIASDSIFVSDAAGAVRAVAGGVGFEAQAARKQLVWSPDSRYVLFRRGSAPFMDYVVADIGSGEVTTIVPESTSDRVRTVGNVYTGPPVWSPNSDRIAFLGSRPGQFGSLSVVYVARRAARGGWASRPLASDSLELTSLGWSQDHLAWASRNRQGRSTIHVARTAGDTIEGAAVVDTGPGRVTALLPDGEGSRMLATKAGAAPLLIDLRGTPRIAPTRLPAEARLDAYAGWLDSSRILAFQYPSTWTSELAILDVATGESRKVVATGGLLGDGTIAASSREARVLYSSEDGSRPRVWHSLSISPDGTASQRARIVPARFTPSADPWATRIVAWRTQDGKPLEAQLLIPNRRGSGIPPTVIVPYGGYRNTALTRTYFMDVLLRQLLDSGWQVIRPNTSAADVLQQKSGYGAVQLDDTEMLIRSLSADGTLDARRVAILGHSHGGSLAYYYATHSTAFCAVVAVNGRADWVMQARHDADGLFPGPLGATPDEDPALYARVSPVSNASRVTAPMLLVAGANDGQILPRNATAMADSLRAHSRPVDLLLFENEGHQIESAANRGELARRVHSTLAPCR